MNRMNASAAGAEADEAEVAALDPAALRHDVITQQTAHQKLTTARRPEHEPHEVVFAVRAAEGPGAGPMVALGVESGRVLVGTSAACHLVLQDHAVSRRHLALEVVRTFLKVSDLGSTNGTVLDGTRIAEAFGVSGSTIRLGQTALHIIEQPAGQSCVPHATSFGRVVGGSIAMRRLYATFERLSSSLVPVLIEGEAGTGKELLAEVLHERGERANEPFVVVDASSSSSADEDLFGGSTSSGSGGFERARGGTLLVDHVSDLPFATQARLLRAMTSDPAVRGGPRVVTTSRRDLDKEVEAGRFREDLFFHLVVGRVELPPLRARGDDIRLLAEHFWRLVDIEDRTLPPDFLRRFEGHVWTHNVRELRAAVTRRAAIGDVDNDGESLECLPPDGAPEHAFRWLLDQQLPFSPTRDLLLAEFERVYVEKALKAHNGNVSRAANASGLARRYFQIMKARRRV